MNLRRADNDQARRLRRHKAIATGLLIAMVALHLLTRAIDEPGFWTLLLRAASEAGIVGGLADWFAVTALFRHPLRLPIPHTALIPRNKDRIGANLGEFISRNFLTEEVVVAKLRSADVAGDIGRWLAQPGNAAFFTDYAFVAVPHIVRSLDDTAIQQLMQDALRVQLERLDIAPILGRTLALLLQTGRHRKLFDRALQHVREVLHEHRGELERAVAEQSRWWVPRKVDRALARMLIDGLLQMLDELTDPEHPVRARFDASTAELIRNLEASPRYRRRIEEAKHWLLERVEYQAFLADAWGDVRELLLAEATTPSSRLRQVVTHGLAEFGLRLEDDRATRERLNRSIEDLAVHLVLPWRDPIGRFISDVVRGWDAEELANRLELEIGRDLQYIRVNGTLVGSLVGAAIFLAVHLAV